MRRTTIKGRKPGMVSLPEPVILDVEMQNPSNLRDSTTSV